MFFCIIIFFITIMLMVINVYKKISVIVLALSIVVCGFTNKSKEFLYKYEVVLNSNDNKDVIKGYLYKEYLIDQYNNLITYLDPSLHTNAVINNIGVFAKDGSYSEYVNGKIVVYVGEAKGDSITGTLKVIVVIIQMLELNSFFLNFL